MSSHLRIALFLILILNGCNTKHPSINELMALTDTNQVVNSSDVSIPNLNETKSNVEIQGDTNAYKTLVLYYMGEIMPYERLYYSMIMANKFDYDNAHYDVYQILIGIYHDSINQIDSLTAYMAIKYLTNAAKGGHPVAQETVRRYNIKLRHDNKSQILRMFSVGHDKKSQILNRYSD